MPNTACILLPRYRCGPSLLACLVTALAGLVVVVPASANSVYRCESNSGVVEYANSLPKQFAADQCEKIELPALTTIQSPKSVQQSSRSSAPAPATAPSVAEGFPSVSSVRQQRRDKARRSILQQELKREQTRLAELQAEYRDGEPERRGDERNYQKYLDRVERLKADINRRESSISALTKEMGALN